MRLRLLAFCFLIAIGQSSAADTPAGFKERDFGPLGGRILMPVDWFASEGSKGSNYMLTVSKEDLASTGRYETGWRLQWIAGITKLANISATQAIQYNIARKKAAEEVLRECDPEKIGEFMRQCLETRAPVPGSPGKKYRIIYTFTWSDELDMMISGTFGAPEEDWEEAAKIYNVIKNFVLMDRARMEAREKSTPSKPITKP